MCTTKKLAAWLLCLALAVVAIAASAVMAFAVEEGHSATESYMSGNRTDSSQDEASCQMHEVCFLVRGFLYKRVQVPDGQTVAAPPEDPLDEGWEFTGWTLDGVEFDFTTPITGDIDIYARYVPEPVANPFKDISLGDPCRKAVLWAVEQGITSGTSATTFSPYQYCTRAQVVTFLWNAAGKPEPISAGMPFADVKTDAWYRDAVLWAVERGVTSGTSATTFSPDAGCTRAQAITFLWNSKGQPEPLITETQFDDVPATAWYRDAVLWAVESGVTFGIADTTFGSDWHCMRATMVSFMYNCMR